MAHPMNYTSFQKYKDTPVQRYVLPIIPSTLVGAGYGHEVVLSENSNLTPAHLGKIPGTYNTKTGRWAGFDWPRQVTTASQLEHFEMWQADTCPIALGFRLGEMVVIDGDSDNAAYIELIIRLAFVIFGKTPVVRCRDGSVRVQLFYRLKPNAKPITKTFTHYVDEQGNKHLCEVLGSGQQTVGEGPHAKGAMHYWQDENPNSLIDNWDDIPEITIAQVDAFKLVLEQESEKLGMTKVKSTRSLMDDRPDLPTFSFDNQESPLLAPDRELLIRAMAFIDLDHPHFDYDAFINMLRAIAAAVGGDTDFLENVVWPWVCENQKEAHGQGPRTEDAGIEWLVARWVSFKDSKIGIDHVLYWAWQFGCAEAGKALQAQSDEENKELWDGVTEFPADGGSDQGADGGTPGGAPVPGVPNGPVAFPYTDMALADLFAAQADGEWCYTPDEGWTRFKNGIYVPDKRILRPVGLVCSAVGDPYRGQGTQGTQIDVACKSSRKHHAVISILQAHPDIYADPSEFDADPWLLNTPEFIIDLRTGEGYPHSTSMRMRNQTAFTPNLNAFGAWEDYKYHCPRFLEALHNMTEDDQDIALLGRHGGAGLVGTDLSQYMLFIHGQGGTGKSAFSDVLMRIQGTYSGPGSTHLFAKKSEKTPFELGDLEFCRAVFVPETLKGMSWDDALVCSVLGGVPVRVERKFKASHPARLFMTITVTGNHLPHFITSSQPNVSGIDRRLLLLPVDKVLNVKVDDHFARKLVAEEGPSILMWFIQHAMEGYQSLEREGSFYGNTVNKAKEAARSYKMRSSPHLAWMAEEDVVVTPGARTNASAAWKSYKQWVLDDNPTHRETKAEFRDNLKAATNGAVTYGRYCDERVFLGMRFKHEHQGQGFSGTGGGDVVPLFPGAKAEDAKK
jgi:putative DNA primase/helicase